MITECVMLCCILYDGGFWDKFRFTGGLWSVLCPFSSNILERPVESNHIKLFLPLSLLLHTHAV